MILILAIWTALIPSLASAEPVSALIATGLIAAGVGATTAGILATGILAAVAIGGSLLMQALQKKPGMPTVEQRGIQTGYTTTGGTEPDKFIIGTYATAGHFVAPPYSHGNANEFLTYIIEVSSVPGVSLSRVIINDDYSTIGGVAHPDYGFPLIGQRLNGADTAWVKFYDGTQTTADPMLVAKYGSHPDRPWTNAHIGKGRAYAILTFYYSREVFNSLPKVRLEINRIPLYDPRKDSSVGGSGTQRWNNVSTWAESKNPAVQIYNIMRGITLPGGDIYGGEVDAADLPLANWFAAMNTCDALIGARKAYESSFEIDVTVPPADIIDELLKACFGQINEFGGVFRLRVGAPASPVLSITDDDIVISDRQTLAPFPGLEATYNAISTQYVEPAALWEAKESEPIYNATWEAEDGERRLPIAVTLPAVTNNSQAQHIANGLINDERRFIVHSMVLPPSAAILEPLDTISWTSKRNGYTAKVFEITEIIDRTDSLLQQVTVRERVPGDVAWTPGQDLPLPTPAGGLTKPLPQTVQSWSVTATAITDAGALNRRPALLLQWDAMAAPDAEFIKYEVRVNATGAVISSGTAPRIDGKKIVDGGILGGTTYGARARYIVQRPTSWTSWANATTADIGITEAELDQIVRDQLSSSQQRLDEAQSLIDAYDIDVQAEFTHLTARMKDPENLIPNGRLEGPGLWTIGAGWSLSSPAGLDFGQSSTGVLLYTWAGGAGVSPPVASDQFTVSPGKRYRAAYQIRRVGASGTLQGRMLLRWFDASGSTISTYTQSNNVTSTTFQTFSAEYVAPPLAVSAQVLLDVNLGLTDTSGYIAGPRVSMVEDVVIDARAELQVLQSTKVDANGAVAAIDTAISAEYNGVQALAQAVTFAEATADKVEAGFIFRAGSGPNAGRLEIVSGSTFDGGGASAIKIAASNIYIDGPTQIADATITNAKIANIIQSTNYSPGVAGWQLNKNGTLDIQKLITGQAIVNGAIITDLIAANAATVSRQSTGGGQQTLSWTPTVSGSVLIFAYCLGKPDAPTELRLKLNSSVIASNTNVKTGDDPVRYSDSQILLVHNIATTAGSALTLQSLPISGLTVINNTIIAIELKR